MMNVFNMEIMRSAPNAKSITTILLVIGFLVTSSLCIYATGGVNSGNPVPYLTNDDLSANFLALRMALDTGGNLNDFMTYAESLAKTLSQYSAADQNYFWHGS